jgi:tetratricopeptide (TPR) repeat protein
VLKRAKKVKTGAKRFVIITAHGSIDTAIEAMKLGAVDYIQKPFSTKAIRDVVRQVLGTEDLSGKTPDGEEAAGDRADDYRALAETAKMRIKEKNYQAAAAYARRAIFKDPSKPEAFNVLGAAAELAGDRENALKYYRTAAALGPAFALALKNLERITNVFGQPSEIYIDDDSPPKRSDRTKTGEIVRHIRRKERNL